MGQPPNKPLLARAIINSYKISIDFVDWDDNGTITHEDMRRAVTTPLCSVARSQPEKTTQAQKNKCFPERPIYGSQTAAAVNQALATQDLDRALRKGDGPPGTEFDLVFKGGVLHFKRVHNATELDAKQRLLPRDDAGQPSLAAQAFAADSKFFEITCEPKGGASAPHPGAAPPPVANGNPGPLTPEQKRAQEAFMAHFRLRGDVSDLTISQDNDGFKGASSASLSATADNVAHKSTLAGKFALGFALNPVQVRDWVFQTIPYVHFERNSTTGTGAPRSASDVDNLGVGILENATVPLPIWKDSYADVTLRSDYTFGLRSNVKIGKLELGYSPRPFMPVIGFPAPLGFLGLRAYLYTTGIINVGQVFDNGGDTTLSDNSTLSQGGVRIATAIYGDDSSPFSGFSIPITYTNLYGFAGPYRSLQKFTVGVNYAITKNFSIGVSHTSGRDLDTFEKLHSYEFKLGIKY